jgi:hypothetical protein
MDCIYRGHLIPVRSQLDNTESTLPTVAALSDPLDKIQDGMGFISSSTPKAQIAGLEWDNLGNLEAPSPRLYDDQSVGDGWDTKMLIPAPRAFQFDSFSQPATPPNLDFLYLQSFTQLQALNSSPPTTHLMRSFTPKPITKPGSQSSAIILIQILKSYPKMMTRRETFPPFIHPYHLSDLSSNSAISDETIPEALLNCMAISKLFYGDKGGRKLLWSIIRMEQERLFSEVTFPPFRIRRRLVDFQ